MISGNFGAKVKFKFFVWAWTCRITYLAEVSSATVTLESTRGLRRDRSGCSSP